MQNSGYGPQNEVKTEPSLFKNLFAAQSPNISCFYWYKNIDSLGIFGTYVQIIVIQSEDLLQMFQ